MRKMLRGAFAAGRWRDAGTRAASSAHRSCVRAAARTGGMWATRENGRRGTGGDEKRTTGEQMQGQRAQAKTGKQPRSSRLREGRPGRIVLYSHDTLGFGHLRRNLMLAARLKALDPAPEVLLIAGTAEAGAFELPEGVDLVTLPAYAKQSCGAYVPRRLSMDLA